MSAANLTDAVWDPAALRAAFFERRALLLRTPPGRHPPGLLSLGDVDEIMVNRLLRYPDVRLVRHGEVIDVGAYTQVAQDDVGPAYLVPERENVYAHFVGGATILLSQVDRCWPAVRRVKEALEQLTDAVCACDALVTPPGAQGLKPHADPHDGVIVQTSGRKTWRVYEPAPPGAGLEQGAVVIDATLAPGDVLLVPRGFPHVAVTEDVASVHLTMILASVMWGDVVLDRVRREAAGAAWYREPVAHRSAGDAALRDELGRRCAAAAAWLHEHEQADALPPVARPRRTAGLPAPRLELLAQLDDLDDRSTFVRAAAVRAQVAEHDGAIVVVLADREIHLPARLADVVARALSGERFALADLAGQLDADGRRVLVRRLVLEGALEPAPAGVGAAGNGSERAG